VPALSIFPSLQGYERRWLRGDIVAGLTVWAVLVPEALAYATIAGVSPVVGLYAAPPALLLYAVFGSSKHLVVGPATATAAVSAAAVAQFATQGSPAYVTATAALAIATGVLGVIAGLLRMGFVANFISEPVLKGFIIGLSLNIIAGQLPKLFGVEKGGSGFFGEIRHLILALPGLSWPTLIIGLISLAIVGGLKARLPVVPGSLVAVAFGIAAVSVFNLDQRGVAIVGPIQSGLPPLGLPRISPGQYLSLAPSAVGVLLVGFAEGLGAAKTYASRNHYAIDANRELLGTGVSNLAAGLCSGMVVNGSLSKTAVNGSAGARSQISGIVVAALTVLTLLFLTSWFQSLPEATLAAIVIVAVVELVDIKALIRLYKVNSRWLTRLYGGVVSRPDFVAALAALLGVLIFDTLPGLFIGIAMSILVLVYRASHPHVAELGRVPGNSHQFGDKERHPENELIPGVVVLRPEGAIFFADATYLRDTIRQHATEEGTKAIVIDGETVPMIDVTAAAMLVDLAGDLVQSNVRLLMAKNVGQVRDSLRANELRDDLIPTFPTVNDAIDFATNNSGSDAE
jgi:sulfate permease, SulP family